MTPIAQTSRMAAEIAEQPAVLYRLSLRKDDLLHRIRRVIPADLRGVALVGRGSSANAALFGRTLAELATARPALLEPPSLHRLYDVQPDFHQYLGVGLSQSGETPDVVATMQALKAAGAVTIGLTTYRDSPLAETVDLCIDLDVGEERAIPTTKAFTAQLALLVILAEALGGRSHTRDQWQRCAEATRLVVTTPAAAEQVARQLDGVIHLSVIAAGPHLGVANEVALKLQETALVAAMGHSAPAYRHGPIALSGAEHPVIAVVSPGEAGEETRTVVGELRERGAPVIVIGPGGDLPVPEGIGDPLFAIPAVVRGQQLALALATLKGLDADHPHGLQKVTRT